MYGLTTAGLLGLDTVQRQPSEEEMKLNKFRQLFYEHQSFIRETATAFASLVDNGVLTKEEARELLNIDGFKQLVSEIKELNLV